MDLEVMTVIELWEQRAHPEGTPTVSVWLEEAGMRGR